jgi:enterobactin synthetase component F
MVGHTAIVNRLLWMQPLSAGRDDVVAQKTPCSFDVSVWEFWWPFIAGAKLVMAEPDAHRDPQAMQSFFARYGVTTTHFVPSMLAAFVASLDAGKRRLLPHAGRCSAAAKRCRPGCAASGSS